jgi:uncharacterized protein YndB with AHSA1/START domain
MSTKEKMGQELEVRKTIVIDASLEIVFKAITDPQELTNWFPDQAIFEPKVGGKMKFSFYKEKSTDEHAREIDYNPGGTVIEFIPNKKVSYTWQLKDIPDFPETTVSWELEEIDANKTRVVLTHSGFTGREEGKLSLKEHDQGWSYFLGRLEEYCKGKREAQ